MRTNPGTMLGNFSGRIPGSFLDFAWPGQQQSTGWKAWGMTSTKDYLHLKN
jgi:hypothetical protein